MRVGVRVSEATRAALNGLEEDDGTSAPKRIYGWLREFAYTPPVQGASSWAALSSALILRGHTRVGNRTFDTDELDRGVGRYAIPDGQGDDWKPSQDEVEIIIGDKMQEVLPRCLAYLDLGATPEGRRQREWDDFPSFVENLVTGKTAEAVARSEAKESEEEGDALYTKRGKAKTKVE